MELMVATMLLVTMVVCVYATVMTSLRLLKPQPTVAMDLARQKMEQLYEAIRGDWWGDVSTNFHPLRVGGTVGDALKSNYTDAVTLDGITYTRSYIVEKINNNIGVERYRRVKVTVSWPD